MEVRILTFVHDRTFESNPNAELSMLDARMFERLSYGTVDRISESTTHAFGMYFKSYTERSREP